MSWNQFMAIFNIGIAAMFGFPFGLGSAAAAFYFLWLVYKETLKDSKL